MPSGGDAPFVQPSFEHDDMANCDMAQFAMNIKLDEITPAPSGFCVSAQGVVRAVHDGDQGETEPRHRRAGSDPFEFDEPCLSPTSPLFCKGRQAAVKLECVESEGPSPMHG